MKALVMIADGIEELETVTVTDILVRGGFDVTLASVNAMQVVAARGLRLTADVLISDVSDNFDIIVCPGGLKGAENLAQSSVLTEYLEARHEAGKWIAAICASPALVLAPLKILHTHQATCYPAFHGHLSKYINQPVVVDRHIITSQGPATAAQFALSIIASLKGQDSANDVAKEALFA